MAIFGAPQKVIIFCPDLWSSGFPTDGFYFDVSLSEQHNLERTATRFPIEFGSEISDHIHRAPRQFAMQAFLTDTPTDFVEAADEAARNLLTSIAQTAGAPVIGPLASTRSKDLYRQLELLGSSDALCEVVTDLQIYQNVVLVKLGVPRSSADGRGLTVDLTFQRLIIARTSTREALTIDDPVSPAPKQTKKLGKKAARPPPDNRTVLLQAGQAVARFIAQ